MDHTQVTTLEDDEDPKKVLNRLKERLRRAFHNNESGEVIKALQSNIREIEALER